MSTRPAPGPRASDPRTTPLHPTGVQPTDRLVAGLHQRFAGVLAGLAFPAPRWQAVTEAEWYGCDGVTRSMLERLPDRTYSSLPDLVTVLAAVLHGRSARVPTPVGATAARAAAGRPRRASPAA